jgi:hypothetical protein
MRLSGFAVAITVLLMSSAWSQERAGQAAPLIVGTSKLNIEKLDVTLVDPIEQPTEN